MYKLANPYMDKKRMKKKHLSIKIAMIMIGFIVVLNGFVTSVPEGISFEGKKHPISNIEFLSDITYEKDGKIIYEQEILENQLKLIEKAKEFIIVDMFLFNDDYDRKNDFPEMARTITNALIHQKQKYPHLTIIFITDEINNCYGAYESKFLKELKENNIEVVITDAMQMRDSNPIYSGIWRTFLQWFGTAGKGWLPNPFNPDGAKVTLRSYLKLLNFKANHRKTMITEQEAIIASANLHDASSYHSNIAFKIKGEIINDLIQSELAVAKFSNHEMSKKLVYKSHHENLKGMKTTLITEGKIKKHLLMEINNTQSKDQIRMGMFYLSDRDIIKALIHAANRGVEVQLILDANVDAFGMKKNGIPNRLVAYELRKKTQGQINIKWYDTHGEQFHTKLTFIEKKDKVIIIGGSANLTRRNLNDYNLETDIKIEADKNHQFVLEVAQYFERLWNNQNGHYTVEISKYEEKSFFKYLLYRFQEWSGLGTF
ncbi:phospholipase D family protein [Clostridiaceae bacterium 35-E11]